MKKLIVVAVAVAGLSAGGATAAAPPVDTATRAHAEAAFAEWLTNDGVEFGPASIACALTGQAGSAVGFCYANNETTGVLGFVAVTADSGETWVFTDLDSPSDDDAPGGDATGDAGSTAGVSIGDGTWLVGTDIEPGTYRTLVPEGDFVTMCYWARLSDVTGEGIITNGIGSEPDQQMVVEVLDTDVAFESTGCGTWERIA